MYPTGEGGEVGKLQVLWGSGYLLGSLLCGGQLVLLLLVLLMIVRRTRGSLVVGARDKGCVTRDPTIYT